MVEALTESDNPRRYLSDLKRKLRKEGSELYENIVQLKLPAADGKMRLTDVATTQQMFRLIQSIPSPKAEPFKQRMAQVAATRLDQMQNPELSIEQAVADYRRLGYSEEWINQRIRRIETRKLLTDEWKRGGVKDWQYASLTDIITSQWSGMTTREYKDFKGLHKEGLRDNMTNVELALNMLAEASTTEISKQQNPTTYSQHAKTARSGGTLENGVITFNNRNDIRVLCYGVGKWFYTNRLVNPEYNEEEAAGNDNYDVEPYIAGPFRLDLRGTSGLSLVRTDASEEPETYFNLQGQPIDAATAKGLVIRVKGANAEKTVLR